MREARHRGFSAGANAHRSHALRFPVRFPNLNTPSSPESASLSYYPWLIFDLEAACDSNGVGWGEAQLL